jgi:hypothetical protein
MDQISFLLCLFLISKFLRQERHIAGRDVTPFVLRRVAELTGGRSLAVNISLVRFTSAKCPPPGFARSSTHRPTSPHAIPSLFPLGHHSAILLTKGQAQCRNRQSHCSRSCHTPGILPCSNPPDHVLHSPSFHACS